MERNDLETHVSETHASLGMQIFKNHLKLNKGLDVQKEQKAQLKNIGL